MYENATRIIQKYEGFSPTLYLCPANVWTIGYGHAVSPQEKILYEELQPIPEDKALELLEQDIKKAAQSVLRLIHVPLTEPQLEALISFVFNLGSGSLQRSTLRMKLNRGEYGEVPNELRKWVYGGGRRLNGLVKRRNEEAALFTS